MIGIPSCLLCVLCVLCGEPDVRRWQVTVTETAGIRRFGYPVSAVVDLGEPVPDVGHFRLLEHGKAVAAQFVPIGDPSRGIRTVSLDFNVGHAPLETRSYAIEYDPRSTPPAVRKGLRVVVDADVFRVIHPSDLEFVVPRNLLGLMAGVRSGKTEYLRPGSVGLIIRSTDDIDFRAGGLGAYGAPVAARVIKDGLLAAKLRFEGTEGLRGNHSVRSVVEMEFPISKSWVYVAWSVDDPKGLISGLGAELNLNVEGKQTLVDFGAGSLVYARLRAGETAVLRQEGPRWRTLVGKAGAPEPYVVAVPGAERAEGWAHVMDNQRCTAVAIADFAKLGGPSAAAEIAVDANGRLRLYRGGTKQLRFWLHFVGMPVHAGAATSPQAMLAPLRVEVGRPK